MREMSKKTTSHSNANGNSGNKISDIKQVFSDIGVIIEVSDKKTLNNFNDSKRVRVTKDGKVF